MCQIICKVCGESITDDSDVIEVRQGFVEKGDYTPESELGYYHADCFKPTDNQPEN